jgi:hypothetical protein
MHPHLSIGRDQYGHFLPGYGRSPTPVIDRFWSKVDKSGDCWLWRACRTWDGYGEFAVQQVTGKWRIVRAHRFAYELTHGPIPDGLQIDHLCRNRACVNSAHMELVTQRINILRGNSFSAREAARTHCPHGHPYDLLNTYADKRGKRYCRACNRISTYRRYHSPPLKHRPRR